MRISCQVRKVDIKDVSLLSVNEVASNALNIVLVDEKEMSEVNIKMDKINVQIRFISIRKSRIFYIMIY